MTLPCKLAAFLAVLITAGCSGPLGPISGGSLSGTEQPAPSNWTFAADADHIQLETMTAAGKPHSVNVWSGVLAGRLFIPTSLVRGADEPHERSWVNNALTNRNVRVRIDGQLYNGEISRVLEPGLEAQVKQAMFKKYGSTADARSARAWIFEVRAADHG